MNTFLKTSAYVTLILLGIFGLTILVSGCGSFGPPIELTEEQKKDPLAPVKVQVIEAQSVVLASYKAIPGNINSGLWSVDFAEKVYDLTEQLEDAVNLVDAAIRAGSPDLATERALAMMELLGSLRTLTQGLVSYDENFWRATGYHLWACGEGNSGGHQYRADTKTVGSDGSRRTTAGFGHLLHEDRDWRGEGRSQRGNFV